MIPVKKQAFLQIGRLTHTKATASQIDTTTMDTANCASKPSFFRKGLTKGKHQRKTKHYVKRISPFCILSELAKSTVLGITVFGTYEYIVHHYMKVNGDTDARSTLLAHMGAGACAGLVQSSVLCTWELISKLTSHPSVPHNLRGSFLTRRAVHHATGYASLFGTFEAMRRLLMYVSHPLEEKNPLSTSLVAAFLAGGIAGQVHHFVNYITSHWKLQLSMDLIKHTRQYVLLPNLRANLSAFGPTALCFVAFHYGEELTERIRNNVDTAMV
jgi:hypothetical protein